MKMMRRWRTGVFWEWEEMKSAEQWCFSIGKKKCSAVFQHRENQCFTAVFQHRENQQCCTAVFQHRESLSL
jgi:hypothetical protein